MLHREELIRVKMFSPLTRVDLAREERVAKYDRLTEELLRVFKNERLQKCAERCSESEELHMAAVTLHKNL
jgi:katanin p80 WD40 repeat-containing subunit B1